MQPTRPSLHVAAVLALALAPLGACEKDNPNFCADGDQRPECTTDAMPIDAVEGCTANPNLCTVDEDCLNDVCVDCTAGNDHQSAECTDPAAPVCGTNRDCRACAADAECDSGLCDHGGCAEVGSVLFVRPDGDDMGGNQCNNPATPCKTVTRALTQVPTPASDPGNLRYIKLMTVGLYAEPGLVSISDKRVVIFGAPLAGTGNDRSVIDRMSNGQTMLIDNDSIVRLERLGISNGENNPTADGITCSSAQLVADGILVDDHDGTGVVGDTCTLTLRDSIVMTNREGGVAVSGAVKVVIVNNIVVDNGGLTSSEFGGIRVGLGIQPASVVQSNTIVGNQAVATDGITCLIPSLTVLNNIIFGEGLKQRVAGTCIFDHTLYGPDDTAGLLGTARGNMPVASIAEFMFQAADDYHIKTGSVAKGKGTVTGIGQEAGTDLDGQARPQGMPDVGADEIPD